MAANFEKPLSQVIEGLSGEYGGLKAILKVSSVKEAIVAATKADERANSLAYWFRFRSHLALNAVLLSALCAGASLVLAGLAEIWPESGTQGRRIFTAAQFLTLSLAIAMFAWNLQGGGKSTWKEARTHAERLRLAQYSALLEMAHFKSEARAPNLLLLTLRFIRQNLFLRQLAHFRTRLAEAEEREATVRSYRKWVIWGLGIATLVALTSGTLVIWSFANGFPGWGETVLSAKSFLLFEALSGAAGTVALGWIAWVAGRSNIFGDNISSRRLKKSLQDLIAIGGDRAAASEVYELALAQAMNGEIDGINEWFATLVEVLGEDHVTWHREMEFGENGSGDGAAIMAALIYQNRSR